MYEQVELFLKSTISPAHIDTMVRFLKDQAEYSGLKIEGTKVDAERISRAMGLVSFAASIIGVSLSRDYRITVTAHDSAASKGNLERLIDSALKNFIFNKDIKVRKSPIYHAQSEPVHAAEQEAMQAEYT